MTKFQAWKMRVEQRTERRRLERRMICRVCDHYCPSQNGTGICEVLPGTAEDRTKKPGDTCDCGGFTPILVKG